MPVYYVGLYLCECIKVTLGDVMLAFGAPYRIEFDQYRAGKLDRIWFLRGSVVTDIDFFDYGYAAVDERIEFIGLYNDRVLALNDCYEPETFGTPQRSLWYGFASRWRYHSFQSTNLECSE